MGHKRGVYTWPLQFFIAAWSFALSEGLGLLIYFSVSALMDNFAIFLFHGDSYCGYVKMVALYSLALLTFLPNCWFSYRYQGTMYDKGTARSKISFVIITILITMLSFVCRLRMVHTLGWAEMIKKLMSPLPLESKVGIAVLVPPVVDGLQSVLLMVSACFARPFIIANDEADFDLEDRCLRHVDSETSNAF